MHTSTGLEHVAVDVIHSFQLSHIIRKLDFAQAKSKLQISCAVIAQEFGFNHWKS